MEAIDSSSRKDRKKEGRNLKRQRIEAAGGVRPRQRHEERDGGGSAAQRCDMEGKEPTDRHNKGSTLPTAEKERNQSTDKVGQGQRRSSTTPAGAPGEGRSKAAPPRPAAGTATAHPDPRRDRQNPHRFGRVMDQPPCPNQPRSSTLSIAIPGSVVANCQTRELKTTLVGQIARAATIYHGTEHPSEPCLVLVVCMRIH